MHDCFKNQTTGTGGITTFANTKLIGNPTQLLQFLFAQLPPLTQKNLATTVRLNLHQDHNLLTRLDLIRIEYS